MLLVVVGVVVFVVVVIVVFVVVVVVDAVIVLFVFLLPGTIRWRSRETGGQDASHDQCVDRCKLC